MPLVKPGYIFPMAQEAATILPAAATIAKTGGVLRRTRGPFPFQEGHAIISGVGKVNAAIAAQKLLDAQCNRIIVIGTGAALDPTIEKGSFITVQYARYHDVNVEPLGFAAGDIPFDEQSVFKTEVNLTLALEHACIQLKKPVIHKKEILTGDQFIADEKKLQWLSDTFPNAACIDMEAAAVGHVLRYSNIPWAVIRFITDHANADSADDFSTQLRTTAPHHIASLVQEINLTLAIPELILDIGEERRHGYQE